MEKSRAPDVCYSRLWQERRGRSITCSVEARIAPEELQSTRCLTRNVNGQLVGHWPRLWNSGGPPKPTKTTMCLGPTKRPLGLVDVHVFPRHEKQMMSALRAKTHPRFSSFPPSIPGHPPQALLALPPVHIPNWLTSLQPHSYLLTWAATAFCLNIYSDSLFSCFAAMHFPRGSRNKLLKM